jgi:hypothetical protein
MSSGEKSAWISFLVSLVAFGAYFASIGIDLSASVRAGYRGAPWLGLVGVIVAVTLFQVAAHTALAARSRAEVQSASDERERLIVLKATRPAFYVLMTGVWLALGVVALGGGVWMLVQATLFAVWVAELTRFGMQIYYYRRGLA